MLNILGETFSSLEYVFLFFPEKVYDVSCSLSPISPESPKDLNT